MKCCSFEISFLTSKVARRVFVQFILCALVPIAVLGIISYTQVAKQLREQGRIRLIHFSKTMGMAVVERLTLLENELQNLSHIIRTNPEILSQSLSGKYGNRLRQQFKGIGFFPDPGNRPPLMGTVARPNDFSSQEKQHLNSGKSLIITRRGPHGTLHIYFAKCLVPKDPAAGVLIAEIRVRYILGLSEYDTLPFRTELCLLDEKDNVLFSTMPIPAFSYRKQVNAAPSGYFNWKSGPTTFLGSFWSIPLKYYFLQSKWTVIMSQPEDYIFSPVSYFKKTFPLVILLSLFVVIFISLVQIRRTMLPLQELKSGARRIGRKEFDRRISISSNDEFQDLARTFNTMAGQLGKQFNTMSAAAEIDRAILSSLKTGKIAQIALTRMTDLFHCSTAGLILLDPDALHLQKAYILEHNANKVKPLEQVRISPAEIAPLLKERDSVMIREGEIIPRFLEPFATNGAHSFTVLPFFIQETFAGIMILGPSDPFERDNDNLVQARLLTNQVAVALSNARLLEELTALNWGALNALARAVDAKSPWTAGHSGRVTATALKIGRALHLSAEDLEHLHRGGLLHDIGKIGVPTYILDKPGKLTPEEWRIIRDHPRMGVKIIEPIAPFKPIIPIILQHHERFDGRGYPDGLAANEIFLGARILTVADAYDAMVSDRPYRKAMTPEQAVHIIQREAGRQFDARVVAAFLKTIYGGTSLGRFVPQDHVPPIYPHSVPS
jgi:putative nucleotidyltransferase with HDIG domain